MEEKTYEQPSAGVKENPPCTPLKENRGRNLDSTVPVPVPIARTYAPAQGTPPAQGTGTVKTGVFGTGTGTAQRRRLQIDADFILDGHNAQGIRNDPVQAAMVALNIPKESNGYNNARLLRYYLRLMDEDSFRELVYQQWRENEIDGLPRNTPAAFMVKLYNATKGGV